MRMVQRLFLVLIALAACTTVGVFLLSLLARAVLLH
jgi:uncharacterized membrane protein YwzB